MKNHFKLIMLGLLLIPLAASIDIGSAYAETVTVDLCPGAANANNDCFFVSEEITMNVGDTVVWTNSDIATHNITCGNVSDPIPQFPICGSGFLNPGSTFEHTFDTPGEYPYLCQLHPWMVGKVIVEPEPIIIWDPYGMVVITTDNDSTNVGLAFPELHIAEVLIVDEYELDEPQEVDLPIIFTHPTKHEPIQDVNYSLKVVDENGNVLVELPRLYARNGFDSHVVSFSEVGSFALTVDIEGTGIDRPFDTKHSGTASLMISVVPEFPISVMVVMGAVIAIGIAVSRFNHLTHRADIMTNVT